MLWNQGCTGNKTGALQSFLNNSGSMMHLVYKSCGFLENRDTPDCIPWRPPPEVNSELISWMREEDCRNSFLEWHTQHPDQSSWSFHDWRLNTVVPATIDWMSMATTTSTVGCCDYCQVLGGNVDVYLSRMQLVIAFLSSEQRLTPLIDIYSPLIQEGLCGGSRSPTLTVQIHQMLHLRSGQE